MLTDVAGMHGVRPIIQFRKFQNSFRTSIGAVPIVDHGAKSATRVANLGDPRQRRIA
jgi:hypothetical protein